MDEMPRFQEDEEKKTRRPVLLIPIILIVLVLIGVAILLFFLLRPQPAGPEPTTPAAFTPIPTSEPTEIPATSPPDAPSNITGDESPIYNVCLNWNDNSDNEDGFKIYRRRLDIIGAPEQSGEVGENVTGFCDLSTFCGATYQYTIASFNEAGESPASVCWQIVMTPCPQIRVMQLGVGLDLGRNFQTGQLGETSDFYLDIGPDGALRLMADKEGQLGLIDLGDLGGLPLTQVELPDNPEWVRDGIPAVAGHVYVALQRDGQSMIIFSLSALGDPSKLEYFIYRPADVIVFEECQRVGGYVPGGTCVSGDGVCDPTCVAASTDQTGQPVPDDVLQQPDQFEEIYGEMIREANSGNILLVAWNFLTDSVFGMILQPPPLEDYPTPTYTDRDYDCTNQPCISYDGVCVPECATDNGYREWDNDQTCQNGGPDYNLTLAADQYIYPLCTPNGETPAPGYGSTADHTGRYVDVDCNPTPCVTGDGVCTPGCIPNPNDQGQPGITQVSYVDGDCGGPCNSNDGICTPLCDPYYNYNTNLTAAYGDQYQANYDRDCGNPCETQDQCGCTPTTTTAGVPYCGEHPGGGDQGCTCGDGYCNPSCENADLCNQDCPCVDNGICEAGETPRCKDCSNEPGAQCGVPCPSGVCGAGLDCQSGICWAPWCAPAQTETPQCTLINCECITAGMSLCYDSCTEAPVYVPDPNCP
jgi:hypothetical protein